MTSHLIPKALPQSQPQPLKPQDIRYLVLEGGGGKGFAYLGAVQVLELLGVMPQIKGFGGASAGAITALLLSMGMGSIDIERFLDKTDFTAFFDPPLPRVQPMAGSGTSRMEDTEAEREFIRNPSIENFAKLFAGGRQLVSNANAGLGVLNALMAALFPLAYVIEKSATSGVMATLVSKFVKAKISSDVLDWIRKKLVEHPPVGQVLWDGGKHYLAYLPRDMGLFSGQAARTVLNELLLERVGRKQRGRRLRVSGDTVTFAQHFQAFGTKLLVTGTNLRTGNTVLFSKDDTPHFPVADAVRISMGLPFIYKPYVVNDGGPQWAPCGVYVDGGVWNNLPYREFDAEAQADARKALKPFTPATLGLRLAIEPPVAINSVADIALVMLSKGLFGSGESQVLDKHSAQTILLDTRGLDLLNFTPDDATRLIAGKRSRRQTMRYFGMGDVIVDADRDDEDDLMSYCLNRSAEACSPSSFEDCVAAAKAAGLVR